ncbi:sulfotransferase [Mucilaginibacter gilvus]|uniref:sulfotransferase n=1 Tax=Mucilaginibacter gilvus TaxID=2305909 RepID=UPI00141958F1|nr:sulfotransferase [Mucilaginibacter gilvus]
MANPINQPPYWLIGRSKPTVSPYIDFARYLLSWWQVITHEPGTPWPHVAVVLAYASATNERFLSRIRQEAPNSRIIHVIREPMATIASRKVTEPGAGIRGALHALKECYTIALRENALKETAYMLLRYEELCDKPEAITCQMASFLRIKHLPGLGQATVAGVSAKANSSFHKNSPSGEILKVEHQQPYTHSRDTQRYRAGGSIRAKIIGLYSFD